MVARTVAGFVGWTTTISLDDIEEGDGAASSAAAAMRQSERTAVAGGSQERTLGTRLTPARCRSARCQEEAPGRRLSSPPPGSLITRPPQEASMPPRALRPAIVLAAAGAVPLALAAVLAPRPPDAAAVSPELRTVVRGSGDIAPTVQRFRSLLGPDNGGAPGSRATGRREINWDAVPDRLARPALLPGDFFNATAAPRARGALLRTPGRGVAVSADAQNAAGAAPRFADLNPSYAAEFRTFSPQRLFSPIGSNVVNLRFVVPGTLRRATVRGFGAVYTGIDRRENTAFEYFDAQGRSLGRFAAPVERRRLSFLGVVFGSARIARVRIEYGNGKLGPDETGSYDVAVMDDFIYGEPQPLP